MSMAEAAGFLGVDRPDPGRWLRRYLLEREKATGTAILVNVGRNPDRPRYRVSAQMLRRHCPELVDSATELQTALRAMLLEARRDHQALREEIDEIKFQLGAILELLRQRN